LKGKGRELKSRRWKGKGFNTEGTENREFAEKRFGVTYLWNPHEIGITGRVE
jgi:hypothetical protein